MKLPRNMQNWIGPYLQRYGLRPTAAHDLKHVVFCIADHFEPHHGGVDDSVALERVKRWVNAWPGIHDRLRGHDGMGIRTTMFYPLEMYSDACIDALEPLLTSGAAELELHLHHRNDSEEGFRSTLQEGCDRLSARGLLGRDGAGTPRFAFVHGNWALCNSKPDGDWCGVNNELDILREAGCYADFTFPSAPSDTQPSRINTVFYARDNGAPSPFYSGPDAAVGTPAPDEHLMLIPGALGLNWSKRKLAILPGIENSELSGVNPPTIQRANVWLSHPVRLKGRPDTAFIKLHTHGCAPANSEMFLGNRFEEGMKRIQQLLDSRGIRCTFATARELYNMIRAIESEASGDVSMHRGNEVMKPLVQG